MKQIHSIIVALLVLVSVAGLGAATVTFTGLANVSTSDTTPTITFTVTDDVNVSDTWLCTLLIDGVDYGTVTDASSGVATSITADTILPSGFSGNYNVSAYNSTNGTFYSDDYTLTTSNFAGIVVILGDVVDVFTPLLDLIIAVGTIMIAIVMIMFVMGLILGLFEFVNSGFKKM